MQKQLTRCLLERAQKIIGLAVTTTGTITSVYRSGAGAAVLIQVRVKLANGKEHQWVILFVNVSVKEVYAFGN